MPKTVNTRQKNGDKMIERKFSVSCADSAPQTAPILLVGDVRDNLITASELRYDAIELHMREDLPADYKEILEISAKYGVRISALVTGRLNTQGMVNLTDDRSYVSQAAFRGLCTYIETASKLGTDIVIGWAKGHIPEGEAPGRFLARLSSHLKALGETAGEAGVRIFLEVINRYETNIFNTSEETRSFIGAYDLPNCYIHLDTFHMGIEETDCCEAIRTAGELLGYFHAADNTRRYPGSGSFDFHKILNTLDEIGYRGYISVECLPYPDGRTAAKLAYDNLRRERKE
jgi:sugar phosphate isomerase/epimerase